jgi:hypothetical protein
MVPEGSGEDRPETEAEITGEEGRGEERLPWTELMSTSVSRDIGSDEGMFVSMALRNARGEGPLSLAFTRESRWRLRRGGGMMSRGVVEGEGKDELFVQSKQTRHNQRETVIM